MTAQVIDIRDARARERRRAIRAVPPSRFPLADLLEGGPFTVSPEIVRPLHEVVVYAVLLADETEAMRAIEEVAALPVDDADARLVRDGLALAFCALLEQAWPSRRTSDFASRIANELFPIAEPEPQEPQEPA